MGEKRSFTLLEVVIAFVILALVVSGVAATLVSIKKLSKQEFGYRYTALNLAKEVLEFGEILKILSDFLPAEMKYYYDNHAGQYRLMEWSGYDPRPSGHPDPFDYLGDIGTKPPNGKGLVPIGAPTSVRIYYKVENDTNFYDAQKENVEIIWREEEGGQEKKEILSVMPIRGVNDQLRLITSDFSW